MVIKKDLNGRKFHQKNRSEAATEGVLQQKVFLEIL